MIFTNGLYKRLLVLLVVLMLVGGINTIMPLGTVYAETDGVPTSTPTPSGKPIGVIFPGIIHERVHKFQTRIIEILGNQLINANKVESKAQIRIAELKQQGKDVSVLESALNKFYDLISIAKQAKDNASATLILHQGYDALGKVSDLGLARDTNKSVEENIIICRENIVQALKTIAGGLKLYKQQYTQQPSSM
jgi:hypothetical protein